MKYVAVAAFTASLAIAGAAQSTGAIVHSEFIYESAPFPSAHASTIVETRDGLVAAWFGGTAERNPDVGIWVSRHDPSTRSARSGQAAWTAPVEVANGVQADGTRLPTWNPVLFQPASGPLVLFYKVGPSTPSGSRSGALHVRPSSRDVRLTPHHRVGRGPTM